VRITISNEQGEILEQGQAVQVDDIWWEYGSATAGSVRVEAFDLAGNVTSLSANADCTELSPSSVSVGPPAELPFQR
jgi:hypothetical protein